MTATPSSGKAGGEVPEANQVRARFVPEVDQPIVSGIHTRYAGRASNHHLNGPLDIARLPIERTTLPQPPRLRDRNRHDASFRSPPGFPPDPAHDATGARECSGRRHGLLLTDIVDRGSSRYVPRSTAGDSSTESPRPRSNPIADGTDCGTGHTISQRLRKLKSIPAELIPLGKTTALLPNAVL